MDLITLSIPFFLALIGVELLVARLRRRPLYRLSDSISDLSCGILSQLAGLLIALVTVAGYSWVQGHWAVQHWLPIPGWPRAAWAWVLVFLLDDFAYYWMHRASHVVNVLWAGHVVHHSSEEFNLTVALRQSSLHGLMSWLFYLPIALLGVPLSMWLVCHALNLVYQFWIHTREVNRLGPLEWVFNTPSHHRVHHGINPEYQDKNFAGTLIIWDRLFGTFEPERAPAVYGITKPLQSWNPVLANVHQFAEIGRQIKAAGTLGDKLRAVFAHPRWRPASLGPPLVPHPVSVEEYVKYEPPVPAALKRYALVQFLVVLAGSIALLRASGRLAPEQLFGAGFFLALSLGNIGGMLEARNWAGVSEAVRLAVLALVTALGLVEGGPVWLLVPLLLFALGSLGWVLSLRRLLTVTDPRAVLVM